MTPPELTLDRDWLGDIKIRVSHPRLSKWSQIVTTSPSSSFRLNCTVS